MDLTIIKSCSILNFQIDIYHYENQRIKFEGKMGLSQQDRFCAEEVRPIKVGMKLWNHGKPCKNSLNLT